MGLVPAPGWDPRYDWAGYPDAGQTPREFDPPRGWIATANQRVTGQDYPYFLTSEWTLPYRWQRITDLLAAKPQHSLDSLRDIQADIVSLATRRLLPFIRHARSTHPLADAAQRQLADFDGTMRADSAAPLIFWAWARHTRGRRVRRRDGRSYVGRIGQAVSRCTRRCARAQRCMVVR